MSTGQKLIEAFTILDKSNGMKYGLCAEHDVILTQIALKDLSDDDKNKLKELGWHENEEFDCIAMFT